MSQLTHQTGSTKNTDVRKAVPLQLNCFEHGSTEEETVFSKARNRAVRQHRVDQKKGNLLDGKIERTVGAIFLKDEAFLSNTMCCPVSHSERFQVCLLALCRTLLLVCCWVCRYFGLVVRFSLNVTLLSPHPTDQEQRYHPFANQHPVK